MLEHTLSDQERNQILQTIEMFEVITQTQQDDYQSLEILKVAYQKLGKSDDSLRVSQRLAVAYNSAGSYSLALQECEAILAVEPNQPEILAMAGDIESRLLQSGQTVVRAKADHGLIETRGATRKHAEGASLIEIDGRGSGKGRKTISLETAESANEQLAKFLVVQQMFPEDQVNTALAAVNVDRGIAPRPEVRVRAARQGPQRAPVEGELLVPGEARGGARRGFGGHGASRLWTPLPRGRVIPSQDGAGGTDP